MQHLDEGTIHAWLDGELPSAEREALEAHIAECEPCAAAVAEARGFVAASTRILTALDSVPGGVVPAASTGSGAPRPVVRRKFFAPHAWLAAAAVLVLSTVTVIATRPGGDAAQLRVATTTRDEQEPAASAAPSEEKAAAPSVEAKGDSMNAPAPMQSGRAVPAGASKPADQTERLKSRLEAERQSTRVRSSAGAPSAPPAPPAPAPAPVPSPAPAPVARAAKEPAAPPASSALSKDLAEKREDVASLNDSAANRRTAANARGVPITGRVTSEAGAPLASASVTLQGAGIGTVTGNDGSYALLVPPARANGQSASLVARLIGYKAASAPVAPSSEPITHDFVLLSNPLMLSQVVVSESETTAANDKLGSAAATDSASPRMLSRKTLHVGGDTVITTIYSVGDVSVSLVEHSAPYDESRQPQLRGAVSELSPKSRAAAASVNSISWTDSAGHTRTLRGPLTQQRLEQLRSTLFGATKP